MKIIYIINARIPTEKAHGYQICKMCEQFAEAGAEVELWVPTRKNEIKQDLFSFYGLLRNFKIEKILSMDFLQLEKYLGRLSLVLQKIFFLVRLLLKKMNQDALIYTRDPEIAWLFTVRGYKVAYEAHIWPKQSGCLNRCLLKKVNYFIVITQGVKEAFLKNSFSLQNILVAPDGVDLERFDINLSKEDARSRLSLPLNEKIVVYTGHLYSWKGADVLAEAALLLPQDVKVYLIGGTRKDVEMFRNKYKMPNLHIVGHRQLREMPVWLKAADVLVLPNKKGEEISEKYTSPLKLFEYMASKRPIVASSLSSIKEILTDDNSILVTPNDPAELAKGIKQSLSNQDLSGRISTRAFQDAQQYGWQKRAEGILRYIKY